MANSVTPASQNWRGGSNTWGAQYVAEQRRLQAEREKAAAKEKADAAPETPSKPNQNIFQRAAGALARNYVNETAKADYENAFHKIPTDKELSDYQERLAAPQQDPNGRGVLAGQAVTPANQQPQPPGALANQFNQPTPEPQQNAQAAGTQAAKDQEAQQKAATQQTADAQQKGGNIAPDAVKDPVGHAAQKNQNASVGVGDAAGNLNPDVPKPMTPDQQQNAQLDQAGKQQSMELNKLEWYKSKSFGIGLLSFGLNLLSGRDLGQAFAAGASMFQQGYGQEQRGTWAEELQKRGYDQLEIQKYVETGDNTVLTSPAERAEKLHRTQMADTLTGLQIQNQQSQLTANQYQNDPERLARLDGDPSIDNTN